ncbi:hypothetical protein L195_g023074 [Trifolium pratense]|uniref:Uncharacterized protein n=1 Tax=Trifolium pratense TaxID=57577 RepID=A0A2K3N9W8_TRIPR|nr:hypothetical protein L195_g023074 [Trifolium pratense]
MDLPTIDVDLEVPKKIEDEKEGGPLFHCSLCDTEVIHKLAQMFLPGLASACVDNTTGGLFKTPGSVAVDLRREMIDYLTLRTESFVAESVILEGGEASDHPFDIISNLVDDFAMGCRSAVAQCMIEKHCLDDLRSHVWHLLKGIYKEAFGDDLQRRVNQIVQALPSNQLSKARDIRSLKFIVKDVEAKLGPFEVSVEQKKNTDTTKDENDNNTNIDSERSTHASDTVISPSSNKAEVNDVSTMQIPENVGKSEEIEHSNIEIKDNEEMIPTSNDKSEENINIEIKGNGETMQTSNGKSGEIEHSNIETKGNEEMIQTSNGKSEDIEHSNIETKNNEEMIQTSNTAKLPSEAEAEVGLVREDITENYNDVVASELKFEGNEENTRKSIEKSAKEISATNEDRVNNNSITNKSIENDNFEDSDNVQSIQNSTMEIAGNVDNNVKNRYTAEDDNLK